jgi:hypothetical protein
MLGGETAEPGERRHRAVADQQQRCPDLHLLDVLGEVSRRHALVDVLVARPARRTLRCAP